MPWRRTLDLSFTALLRDAVAALSREDADRLTEIRVYIGSPVHLVFSDGERLVGAKVNSLEMEALLGALCAHSRYAFESQMAKGYIPLPGGHRAGVCGRVTYENGCIVRMSAITSVCIRIAREVQDASISIRSFLQAHGRPARVLLLGPPGAGKTTVLRDAAKYLSQERRLHVAAADEREELFPEGECMDIDVLHGADKSDAVMMLVRSMSPQVIICDELGNQEDARAMLYAASCGIGVLASAHADCFGDVMKRPALSLLFQNRAFDWYVLLASAGRVVGAMDTDGKETGLTGYGESGHGRDGNDRSERHRLSACRRREEKNQMDSGDAALSAQAQRYGAV